MKPVTPVLTQSELPSATSLREARSAPPHAAQQPLLRSRQLFGAGNELWIEHAGALYRLRITQANKLILTK